MSHFYASIDGNRGQATRCGSKDSGIRGHIRGWDIGAFVVIRHIDGKDVCSIFRTGGSNGNKPDKLIAEFSEETKP